MRAIAEGLIGRGTAPAEVERALGDWIGDPIPVNERGVSAVYSERAVLQYDNCGHGITPLYRVYSLPLGSLSGATSPSAPVVRHTKNGGVRKSARTMLSPTTGVLTFEGTADGTCFGQEIKSVIWGTSVYVKDGDGWKWAFGINTPSRGNGA